MFAQQTFNRRLQIHIVTCNSHLQTSIAGGCAFAGERWHFAGEDLQMTLSMCAGRQLQRAENTDSQQVKKRPRQKGKAVGKNNARRENQLAAGEESTTTERQRNWKDNARRENRLAAGEEETATERQSNWKDNARREDRLAASEE